MTSNTNNINNAISDIDLLYLTNKAVYEKYTTTNVIDTDKHFKKDLLFYKKRIHVDTKELYRNIAGIVDDNSKNTIADITNQDSEVLNETTKYKDYYKLYLLNLVKYYKHQDSKSYIQDELNTCTNKSDNNNKEFNENSTSIDMSYNEYIKNNKPKQKLIDEFVKKTSTKKEVKILPQQKKINLRDPKHRLSNK